MIDFQSNLNPGTIDNRMKRGRMKGVRNEMYSASKATPRSRTEMRISFSLRSTLPQQGGKFMVYVTGEKKFSACQTLSVYNVHVFLQHLNYEIAVTLARCALPTTQPQNLVARLKSYKLFSFISVAFFFVRILIVYSNKNLLKRAKIMRTTVRSLAYDSLRQPRPIGLIQSAQSRYLVQFKGPNLAFNSTNESEWDYRGRDGRGCKNETKKKTF